MELERKHWKCGDWIYGLNIWDGFGIGFWTVFLHGFEMDWVEEIELMDWGRGREGRERKERKGREGIWKRGDIGLEGYSIHTI